MSGLKLRHVTVIRGNARDGMIRERDMASLALVLWSGSIEIVADHDELDKTVVRMTSTGHDHAAEGHLREVFRVESWQMRGTSVDLADRQVRKIVAHLMVLGFGKPDVSSDALAWEPYRVELGPGRRIVLAANALGRLCAIVRRELDTMADHNCLGSIGRESELLTVHPDLAGPDGFAVDFEGWLRMELAVAEDDEVEA